MALQAAEREKHPVVPTHRRFFPVTRTIAGPEGYRFLQTVSEGGADFTVYGSYAVAANVSLSFSIVGCVHYAGVGVYDTDFVRAIHAADAAEPEAEFHN